MVYEQHVLKEIFMTLLLGKQIVQQPHKCVKTSPFPRSGSQTA